MPKRPRDDARERMWMSVRELSMRDFSQDASLHAGAPTALGTKSQPAGGIPVPPPDLPTWLKATGVIPVEREGALRFGFDRGFDADPNDEWNAVRPALREEWERGHRHQGEWEEVEAVVRRGWERGHACAKAT